METIPGILRSNGCGASAENAQSNKNPKLVCMNRILRGNWTYDTMKPHLREDARPNAENASDTKKTACTTILACHHHGASGGSDGEKALWAHRPRRKASRMAKTINMSRLRFIMLRPTSALSRTVLGVGSRSLFADVIFYSFFLSRVDCLSQREPRSSVAYSWKPSLVQKPRPRSLPLGTSTSTWSTRGSEDSSARTRRTVSVP